MYKLSLITLVKTYFKTQNLYFCSKSFLMTFIAESYLTISPDIVFNALNSTQFVGDHDVT